MDTFDRYKKWFKKFNLKDNLLSRLPSNAPKINNENTALTEGFSTKELSIFYNDLGAELKIDKNQIIFEERDFSDSFYIIIEGEAEVYITTTNRFKEKQYNTLAVLKENDIIGDMALVDNKPRSASVRAKTNLILRKFPLDKLSNYPHINLLLTRNMAKVLAEKLRFTNQVTVKKMEESLEQALARNVLGVFMIGIFWFVGLYTISLTSLILVEKQLANTTFLSVGLIIFFATGIVTAMKLTGLPLKHFGISLDNWRKKCIQAVGYSIPIMIAALLLKISIIYFNGNPNHIAIFSGFAEGMIDGTFNLKLYVFVTFFYAFLIPIQELSARCALQSTFSSFLPGNETFRTWNAILLSNLIFSSVHSHLSLMFAAVTFVPGIFWGWLFHKQHSLLSVTISHIMIGVWTIFIVGIKGVLY